METNLLDKMLGVYRDGRTPVTVVLQNKTRISGTIAAFDSYVIVMESRKREIVYRHAIASLAPFVAGRDQAGDAKIEHHQRPAPKPAPVQAATPPRPAAKQRTPRPAPRQDAPREPSLNTGMKEGLLRWMREQKAGK